LAPPHTSELLEELVSKAPDGPVDLEWLLGHLDKRSFGLLLLLLGLLVIIPGIATIATLALLFPAVEMMLGWSAPSFPRFLSKRLQAFQAVHGPGPSAAASDRERQPAAVERASRCDGPPRRVGRLSVGVVRRLATASGERHSGDGGCCDRDRLPSGGRPVAGHRDGDRTDLLARPWLDALDVGWSLDRLDRALNATA
jgi:hypothetical protein